MTTSQSHGRTRLLQVAVLALFAATLANTAWPKGNSSEEVIQSPTIPGSLQDENLVPVHPDVSNPGGLEPNPLWSSLDEDTPNDDSDYVFRNRLGLPPTYNEATVELSDPVGNPNSSQEHTVRVRWKVTGNYSTNSPQPTLLFYTLLEGTTPIASGSVSPSGSYSSGSRVLLTSEKNSITNYSALRIRLSLQLKPAGANDQIQGRVTWARLEIR